MEGSIANKTYTNLLEPKQASVAALKKSDENRYSKSLIFPQVRTESKQN